MRCLTLLLALLLSPLAVADWQLQTDYSRISFVSVKRGDSAEVQRFTGLTGMVDAQGGVRIVVPFSGLDSGLALRDERMRSELFQVARFSEAQVSSQVDLAAWEEMAVGASKIDTIELQISLHGQERRLKAEVLVSRIGEHNMQVGTLEPVLLKAVDFDLVEGLQRLEEISAVPQITPEVPVFALLTFQWHP
jgi:polyisoprenoid-binding protein YceI